MTSGNGSARCRYPRVWALTLCCTVMLGQIVVIPSAVRAAEETQAQRDARMKWWREARFGMFIHWGLYSVPAGTYHGKKIDGIGEWIMHNGPIPVAEYQAYAKQFNPVKFDADEWVRLAKEAGQKYIVITSKHHDGFAMYHSKAHPFNIYDATPFKRDPLQELAAACKKHGVKLGFYYSQAQDWTAPGGASFRKHWDKAQDGSMDQYIDEKAVPQVKEILTNYGEVAVLWWDTPVGMNKARADKLLPLLALQPNIIWNNRLGGGYLGDSETPEQTIPATGFKNRDWETCMTMNNTWGYKSYDQNWKPTELLLRNLIDISSKGGNYLLNVGPTSEGLIPEPSVERLKQMGAWLKINGEAIYATTANPFKKAPSWGRVTKKPGKLYLHVFTWPADQKLSLPTLGAKAEKAWMLADPEKKPLDIASTEESVTITVPKEAPDKIASVVVLEYSGELKPVDSRVRPAKDGSLSLGAEDAEIHGHTTQLEGKKNGPKNIGYWRNADNWISWSGRIDKPGKYKVEMVYSCPSASKGTTFDLEIGAAKLDGTVAATDGWDDYKSHPIGEVTIDKPGPLEVVLRPKKKPGDAIMNLRSIALRPVK